MRLILIVIIKLYWLLIPKHRRRRCLFKKSCSIYVYEITKSEGLISGLGALRYRINNCNSHYNIMKINGEKVLVSKTNKVFNKKQINTSILK